MRMLIDGTKLYFASKRMLSKHARLDYEQIANITLKEKIYYTTYNPGNNSQDNFLNILKSFQYKIMPEAVSGDETYDFDSDIAYMLGRMHEPCYVFSNSKYLVPMIQRSGSTLCWFSDDLPAVSLLRAYRDKNMKFMDISEYVTYFSEGR